MAVSCHRPPGQLVADPEINLRLGGTMRRRDFLRLGGSAAAGALLAPSTSLAQPASRLNRIEHFIVLMLENRSFDSMLGMLGRYYQKPKTFDGLRGAESNADSDGRSIRVSHIGRKVEYHPI